MGGRHDLILQFALDGELTPRFGVVHYAAISAEIPGDYNHDGKVDAADYVVWRKAGINGSKRFNSGGHFNRVGLQRLGGRE